MLNKELLMVGGSYTNGALPTEEEFKQVVDYLRMLVPNTAFIVFFSPDIQIDALQLDTVSDAYGSDVTVDYELHVITDSNYIYITHTDGHSGGSPYGLYLSGVDELDYKLLYRTNDPTNQTTVSYWKGGDMLRIVNVPDKFDGFIIAQ